jgi:hypothetical protein
LSTDYALLRTLLQLSRTRVDATENYITECSKFLSTRPEGGSKDDYRNIHNRLDRAITNKCPK